MPDDRLRLIFTCCHPALATGAQVALTLRRVGRRDEAALAYTAAIARTDNARERDFLERKRQALTRA